MGAWLFQGNERDKFPISHYLRRAYEQSREVQWNVGRTRLPVSVGDLAFMWRSEGGRPGTGGVIAVGRVTRQPVREPDEAPELWYDPESPGAADPYLWRVRIRLEELRLTPDAGLVRRVDLKSDPDLHDLCIVQRWRGVTVCEIDDRHARALLERWQARGRRR